MNQPNTKTGLGEALAKDESMAAFMKGNPVEDWDEAHNLIYDEK